MTAKKPKPEKPVPMKPYKAWVAVDADGEVLSSFARRRSYLLHWTSARIAHVLVTEIERPMKRKGKDE